MMMKVELHTRNRHRESYDFEQLVAAYEPLAPFVAVNRYGDTSIDFFNPEAVLALNRAILAMYYHVLYYSLPAGALIPPIPGRADYIHYIADLLHLKSDARCLDVGVGANCIYPIIGVCEYGWNFVGSDIALSSVESARAIVEQNDVLRGRVVIRHQVERRNIFRGVILPEDRFDVTICNPPFHDSPESAQRAAMRKLRNLKGVKAKDAKLNFAGRSNELWCRGGERKFIERMIDESLDFSANCGWFTTLVSSEDNLPPLIKRLQSYGAQYRVIEMAQGNKRSRILAWRVRS